MRKLKFLTITVMTSLSIGMFCCKKESATPTTTVVSSCLITNIKYFQSGQSSPVLDISFTYDKSGNLTQITKVDLAAGTYQYNYNWSNGHVIGVNVTGPISYNSNEIHTWEYKNNLLQKITEVDANGSTDYVLSYNSNGKISKIDVDGTFTYSFVYSGQNCSLINNAGSYQLPPGGDYIKGPFSYQLSEFDTKNNPWLLLAKAINNPTFFPHGIESEDIEIVYDNAFGQNNIGKDVRTDSNTRTSTFDYTYNTSGYPTQIVRTDVYGSFPPYVYTTVFTYSGCN